MLRNVLIALGFLALVVPCRAQVPPLPCSAGGGLTVRGRIMDPPGGGIDGVACCRVGIVALGRFIETRTRADGTFEACIECSSPDGGLVSATSQCCSASAEQVAPQCFDPLTGLGVTVDLGDIACSDAPATDATLLHGSVLCRSGALLQPVADCSVIHDAARDLGGFTRTDANGDYAMCSSCAPFVDVTAQCCGQSRMIDLSACPERFQVPTMVCDPCPAPPCAQPRDIEIRGRLTCGDADGDGMPDPVVGCDVRLAEVNAGCLNVSVTTDANGFYSACVACPAEGLCPDSWAFDSRASCCPGYELTHVDGCPPVIDLGTRECCPVVPQPCPQGETIVRGRLICVDPAMPVPVPMANSNVWIRFPICGNPAVYRATTDANGYYSACVPCAGCATVEVTAADCLESAIGSLACGMESIVDVTCSACPGLPPCGREQEIRGGVSCGQIFPEPGAAVRITCPDNPAVLDTVITDINGGFFDCIACGACAVVRATALRCGASVDMPTTPGCSPLLAGIDCGDCRLLPETCGPHLQTVGGRVSCDHDGDGVLEPIAGCAVRVDCDGGRVSVTSVTNAAGDYVACFPCTGLGCLSVYAMALCCGQTTHAPVEEIFCAPARADIECLNCPARPCPAPSGSLVSGTLLCAQGNDQIPLAGCEVLLEALDADGTLLPDAVTAVTDASGRYETCVPCPNGVASIRATAQCCSVSTQSPAADCPETLSLGAMLCAECSPCPAGSTRLQGQIHCRGGGPVADCALRVVLETCDETLVFEARTDAQGKYRLCVPCPCDDTDVRVTALCCNATRVTHVDRCGPITPMPALFCPSPCR